MVLSNTFWLTTNSTYWQAQTYSEDNACMKGKLPALVCNYINGFRNSTNLSLFSLIQKISSHLFLSVSQHILLRWVSCAPVALQQKKKKNACAQEFSKKNRTVGHLQLVIVLSFMHSTAKYKIPLAFSFVLWKKHPNLT